jgi:hypothetical protein
MANTGNFSAYRQLTPLKGDVSDDLQNQQQLNNQKRGLDLEEQRMEGFRQQAQDKRKQDLADYVQSKIPKNIDTKVKSLTEVSNIHIQEGADRIGVIGAVLMEDADKNNLTYQERAKLTSELESINRLPENLKMAASAMTEKANFYTKGLADGSLRRNLDFEKFMDIGTNGVYASLGPDGKPLLAYDTNQDGKIDIIDFDNITTGLKGFEFKKDYDYEDVVNSLSAKIQPEINETVDGNLIVKTTGLNKDELENRVRATLYNPDGSPSDVLEAFADKKKVFLTNADGTLNTKGLDIIETELKNTLLLRSKKGKEEKVNTEVRQQAEFNYRKNRDATVDKKDKDKQELDTNTVSVTDTYDPLLDMTTTSTTRKSSTKVPRGNSNNEAKPKPAPAKREINSTDIAAKAKKAGYTVKEYEALLFKQGVKIIQNGRGI